KRPQIAVVVAQGDLKKRKDTRRRYLDLHTRGLLNPSGFKLRIQGTLKTLVRKQTEPVQAFGAHEERKG
ncbi:hypothetical protein ATANTOWER_022654, partial [Ataeniobius toweri]|nr:hypothetical protein [Ataeniobius toweri]